VAPIHVFALVLAGGEGKRLAPLTADRAKPAVPFGGNYRLIDFALSNLVNAAYLRIVVLTQYKSHSLDRHIATTDQVYASMGNYVFTTDVLVEAVTADAADERSRHDIGGNLIPALVERGLAQVYDFAANEVPGVSEREHSYWRDVGTLDAFYDARTDLICVDPVFDLYNREWPILTWPEPLPPAKFLSRRMAARGGRSTRWCAPA
jgi:ADP-glucose pyrophosphorylase